MKAIRRFSRAILGVVVISLLAPITACNFGPTDYPKQTDYSDQIDSFAADLNAIRDREQPDFVTGVRFRNTDAMLDFVKDGVWQRVSVTLDGAEQRSDHSSFAKASHSGPSIDEVAEDARRLHTHCSDSDYFEVRMQVVSPTATKTEVSCASMSPPDLTFLNGEELPVLSGGWTEENLNTLWEELKLITDTHEAIEVRLSKGKADTTFHTAVDNSDSCNVRWSRTFDAPIETIARCQSRGARSQIDLEEFTPARVAAAIATAETKVGVNNPKADNSQSTTVRLVNRTKCHGISVRTSADTGSVFVSANDWRIADLPFC